MKLCLMPVLALALAACAPDSSKLMVEVAQVAASYMASTDINKSLTILDASPGTTSVTGQGRIARGPAAIRDEANKQITRLPQLAVSVGNMEIRSLGPAHALAVVPFGVGPSATPEKPTTVGTATLVLAKKDSGWKVIHEHFSYTAAPKS